MPPPVGLFAAPAPASEAACGAFSLRSLLQSLARRGFVIGWNLQIQMTPLQKSTKMRLYDIFDGIKSHIKICIKRKKSDKNTDIWIFDGKNSRKSTSFRFYKQISRFLQHFFPTKKWYFDFLTEYFSFSQKFYMILFRQKFSFSCFCWKISELMTLYVRWTFLNHRVHIMV